MNCAFQPYSPSLSRAVKSSGALCVSQADAFFHPVLLLPFSVVLFKPIRLDCGVTSYSFTSSLAHQHHQASNALQGILTVHMDCPTVPADSFHRFQEATLRWQKCTETSCLTENGWIAFGVFNEFRERLVCIFLPKPNKTMVFLHCPDLFG